MTDQKEVLELFEKCGGSFSGGTAVKCALTDQQLFAFASALRKETVLDFVKSYQASDAAKQYRAILQSQVLEEFITRVNNTTLIPHAVLFSQAMKIAESMAAELRQSAAQPEGNGGVK